MRYFLVVSRLEAVEIRFFIPKPLTLEHQRRGVAACDLVKAALESLGYTAPPRRLEGALHFFVALDAQTGISPLIRRLNGQIRNIMEAPIAPKVVDEILGITAQERIRWYKDGRLPTHGRARGGSHYQKIFHPLFRLDEITAISFDPNRIRRWRSEDRW